MGYTEKAQSVMLILGWDLCELLTPSGHSLLAVTSSQNAIICRILPGLIIHSFKTMKHC